MTKRNEILEASDEYIDEAVKFADPMVLRGLLYQLTGDEALHKIALAEARYGFVDVKYVRDEADVEMLQKKAAAFLKSYRDAGADGIDIGPAERLLDSVRLTAGDDIADEERTLWIEQLALDPWARGLKWANKPDAERLGSFKVAVIGCGLAGLNAATQLKRADINFSVFEKNDHVGGTWYENQYPGARVDTPALTYSHLYGVDFGFSYMFCPQSENLRYCNWIADTFGIRDSIRFNSEVKSIKWIDATKVWELTFEGPDGIVTEQFNAVITAVGFLSRPNVPEIPGKDSFKGQSFHTARWPNGLDVTGKRVAVIGTGATGYQMVPQLAKIAGNVTVFQRAASWVFPVDGYLSPYPDEVMWLERNFPYFTNFNRLNLSLLSGPDRVLPSYRLDPEFEDDFARSARNKEIRDARIDYIKQKFAGRPELVEPMIPGPPPLSFRYVLADSEYNIYDALLRDNVTLASDPIDEITPTGITTKNGTHHEFDIIVFATGFKANEFLWPMEIEGRDSSIGEFWSVDGARAGSVAKIGGSQR